MKKLLPVLILFVSCSQIIKKKDISDSSNSLTGKTETLELNYISWACECANWITPEDHVKYQDDDNLDKHCIFIEPSNNSLELPLYFAPMRHSIKVEGQFYVKPDYPKGMPYSEEKPDRARVFRYTKIEVKEIPVIYAPEDDTTLTLSYNAISCTCAQWSDATANTTPATREYIFLERGDHKLVDANSLWTGNNLPLQIKVTGQYVSEYGYPTGYNPAKGNPEPAKVFRYTKIRVLKNRGVK